MSNYSDSSFQEDSNSSWAKSLKLIPAGKTVLDVGCSSGTFGEELINKKSCVVDGIEIDDGDIAEAKKKLRNVYKIDIERDTIDIGKKYDVIFFGDVVEHLARPVQALEKIKPLLKDDGILVYSIPNITHMLVRLMLISGKIEYGRTGLLDETHLHFYNSQEIYRVFNAAGYEIEIFDYTVNDMPYELVKKNLAELGLEPNEKFKPLLKSVDGAAYQFVGAAKKSKTTSKQTLPKSSPQNTVEDYIKEMSAQYEEAIKGLSDERKKIIKDMDGLIAERDALKAELVKSGRYRKLARRKLAAGAKRIRRVGDGR